MLNCLLYILTVVLSGRKSIFGRAVEYEDMTTSLNRVRNFLYDVWFDHGHLFFTERCLGTRHQTPLSEM